MERKFSSPRLDILGWQWLKGVANAGTQKAIFNSFELTIKPSWLHHEEVGVINVQAERHDKQ